MCIRDRLMGHGYYIPETAQYYVSNFIAAGATAILCGSDAIAKGVISECQLHGFNVPNDISAVSYTHLDVYKRQQIHYTRMALACQCDMVTLVCILQISHINKT